MVQNKELDENKESEKTFFNKIKETVKEVKKQSL